jgi:hypothetical protein
LCDYKYDDEGGRYIGFNISDPINAEADRRYVRDLEESVAAMDTTIAELTKKIATLQSQVTEPTTIDEPWSGMRR